MITFEQFNQFIGHIIWPVTVLIALWMYRKHLIGVIKRLGSIEAGAGGISMKFDNKIEETFEDFLPANTDSVKSKSGVKIKSALKTVASPYHQLLNIRESLHNQIIRKAQENNITTLNKSSIELCEALNDLDLISNKNTRFFLALIDLTNSGDKSINQNQVDKVKELFNNLQL